MEKMNKRSLWTDYETEIIFDVWRKYFCAIRQTKRNAGVYLKFQNDLKQLNVIKNIDEIKSKVKNLSNKYREEKKLIVATNGTPSAWRYFEKTRDIFENSTTNDISLKTELVSDDTSCLTKLLKICENESTFESDPPTASDPLDTSSLSAITATLPSPLPSTSSSKERPTKRKISIIHDELLTEIKRANLIAEKQMDSTNLILEQCNEIARTNLALHKKLLDVLISKSNSK